MMTNKEIGAAIRSELKEAGYKTRDFSTRVKDSGYSTTICIEIKNPTINRKNIVELLNHWQEVDRDERTGEILLGGNTYLFISYASGIFDEVAQEWAATAKSAFSIKDETIRIFDGLYLINLEHSGQFEIRQQNENDHCAFNCYSFDELCKFIYKFAKFGSIAV